MLKPTQIAELVQLPLDHLVQLYPNHIMHCLNSDEDVLSPRQLHPTFYGCYDWHSAVHGYWMLLRGLELAPDLAAKEAIIERFDQHFTAENLATEYQYFITENRGSFERPYGYAWLLALTAKLTVSSLDQAPRWLTLIKPLADLLADKLITYLVNLPYAIRVGTHYNTAFALILSLDYAQLTQHQPLQKAITTFCQRCFATDSQYPLHYEPNGDDFLSGGLCEALLMCRVLEQPVAWLNNFLPGLAQSQLSLTPAQITDPSDAKLSHLEGLNLSRAWCLKQIAKQLPTGTTQDYCQKLAQSHLNASIHHVVGSHYSGSHWLATFALLALEP
jgi:hypothetical protein